MIGFALQEEVWSVGLEGKQMVGRMDDDGVSRVCHFLNLNVSRKKGTLVFIQLALMWQQKHRMNGESFICWALCLKDQSPLTMNSEGRCCVLLTPDP